MRLYGKLAVIVLLAVFTQWTLKCTEANGAEWWFAARCGVAFYINDEQMQERLIVEAQGFGACYEPVYVNVAGPSD